MGVTSTILPNGTVTHLRPEFAPNASRPRLGAPYNLVATKQGGGTEVVALFVDIALQVPIPAPALFRGGSIFVGLGPLHVGLGIVSPLVPSTFSVPLPTCTTQIYSTVVFQAIVLPASGPWLLSDGVVAHLGNL